MSEHIEEYLEALWLSEERGHNITKISWVAKQLAVAPSSVFEMLKKLEADELLTYHPYKGVTLTPQGKQIAQRIIRNHRLIEVLMNTTLNIAVDEFVACGFEHHMTQQFTEALCTQLDHPQYCPHGNRIPPGNCCSEHR
jgi:DtxR family Mn-dependent transcriptional regulator